MRLAAPLLLAAQLGCQNERWPAADAPPDDRAQTLDADADGFSEDQDCNDRDPTRNPAAVELCDGIDNDCDGQIDEGVTDVWYADTDGDGYGDASAPLEACSPPAASATAGTDCDDTDGAVFPAAQEACDGLDNDCDGEVDEGVKGTFYADADGDGHGDPATALLACDRPDGWVDAARDCDDADAAVAPGQVEVCDGIDNDCDGEVDEAGATDARTFYADVDGDGYGDPEAPARACDAPAAHVTDATDCDDTDGGVYPRAQEVCNEVDDDCDGRIDDDDASLDTLTGSIWYPDRDRDRFGDYRNPVRACRQPVDTVTDATDCDDRDATVHPSASEICNSWDDDCDGDIDDDDASLDASTATDWYADADGDGYGDASAVTTACSQPSDTVADATDCDDDDAETWPGALEQCDGVDNDCDGVIDPDWVDADFSALPSSLTLNGSASVTGGVLELTPAAANQAGSVVLVDLQDATSWQATFEVRMGGGTGGDGLALFWLDPTSPDTSLGGTGDDLGFRGLTGLAVELDSHTDAADPDGDHIDVASGAGAVYATDSTLDPLHEGGWRTVEVVFEAGDLRAWVDGTLHLDTTLPATGWDAARFGLSAATGTATNAHEIDDLVLTCY